MQWRTHARGAGALAAGIQTAVGGCEPHFQGLCGRGGGIVEATGPQQHPSERVEPGAPLASNPAESFLPAGPGAPVRGGPPPKSARALPWREGMCLWTTSWKPAPCSPWAYTLASRPVSSRSCQSRRCHQRRRGAWVWEGSEGGWNGSGQPHPTTRSL